ncbi:hypothetical protein, variant [Sphaeroforma arctica JP610]|nr:hypothetical protein, variant [Sphaeroforma arctica JP610]KNC76547.1 hypothetical protein, variant [Sphaeroforma arctica JP610]|eukprot:XP_014150449.1 hypothetical protein, variant [Sphaeroforma arctica JP610]
MSQSFASTVSGSIYASGSTSPSSPDSARSDASGGRLDYNSGSDNTANLMSPPGLNPTIYEQYFNLAQPMFVPTPTAMQQAQAALMAATSAAVYNHNVSRMSSLAQGTKIAPNGYAKVPINRLIPTLSQFPTSTSEAPPITDFSKPTKPHNVIERRYRDKLSGQLSSLRDAIPACRGHTKVNKATIMKLAAEYIAELEERLKSSEKRANAYHSVLENHGLLHFVGDHPVSEPREVPAPSVHSSIVPTIPIIYNISAGSALEGVHKSLPKAPETPPSCLDESKATSKTHDGATIRPEQSQASSTPSDLLLAQAPVPPSVLQTCVDENERPQKRQRVGTSMKLSMALFCAVLIFNPLTQWLSTGELYAQPHTISSGTSAPQMRVLHSFNGDSMGTTRTDGDWASEQQYHALYAYTTMWLDFLWLLVRVLGGLLVLTNLLNSEHQADVTDTELAKALTYAKLADTALDQGRYAEVFQLSRQGLATLSRDIPDDKVHTVLSFVWQMLRQVSHFLRYGGWIEGICANRSEVSRSLCTLLAQLYSSLAASCIMLSVDDVDCEANGVDSDTSVSISQLMLSCLMSLNSAQAGIYVTGCTTTGDVIHAYDRVALALLIIGRTSCTSIFAAGWWAPGLASYCLQRGVKSTSYLDYIVSTGCVSDLKDYTGFIRSMSDNSRGGFSSLPRTIEYSDPLVLVEYGYRQSRLVYLFEKIQQELPNGSIKESSKQLYTQAMQNLTEIYESSKVADDPVTGRLALLGMTTCSAVLAFASSKSTSSKNLNELRELVMDLQSAQVVDGDMRSGGERALYCTIVALLCKYEGRITYTLDALAHATIELSNANCASIPVSSILACIAAELAIEARIAIWSADDCKTSHREFSRASQLNIWSLGRVSTVYKPAASAQARLQAKLLLMGRRNILQNRLHVRKAQHMAAKLDCQRIGS